MLNVSHKFFALDPKLCWAAPGHGNHVNEFLFYYVDKKEKTR